MPPEQRDAHYARLIADVDDAPTKEIASATYGPGAMTEYDREQRQKAKTSPADPNAVG